MYELDEETFGAKIKVIGVGGAGGNAINTMIDFDLKGVEFIAANTDMQALRNSKAQVLLQLGPALTKGLGAGSNPETGRQAALEDRERLAEVLQGADMVFVTAGMGGGTGTGAAPVIAQTAREVGALTVGVVTKPFTLEGKQRRKAAEQGIEHLRGCVDSLVIIPNDKLLMHTGKKMTFLQAFQMADGVLYQGVRGITDIIHLPGMMNVDFADVRTVMQNQGMALMGIGEAEGETRAAEAAESAMSSPLLDDVNIKGARGILMNITVASPANFGMDELETAMQIVQEEGHDDALFKAGVVFDENVGDRMRITVIATGFGAAAQAGTGRQVVNLPRRAVANGGGASASTTTGAREVQPMAAPEREYSRDFSMPDTQGFHDQLGPVQGDDNNALDVPAFLRRQRD